MAATALATWTLAPCSLEVFHSWSTVSCCAGQTATLTLDMQIFGTAVLPFTTDKQSIITQGVATFLNSGVTASQIILTVENTIAGVRNTPSCREDPQDGMFPFLQSVIDFDGIYEHFCMARRPTCISAHVECMQAVCKSGA